jgi:hypothetical protein
MRTESKLMRLLASDESLSFCGERKSSAAAPSVAEDLAALVTPEYRVTSRSLAYTAIG